MRRVALKFFIEDRYQEFLIAELSELDFDAFEQSERSLVAYITASQWDDVKREQIERWLAANEQSTAFTESVIREENWNRQWEETVGPIAVGPFLVKPTWRDVPDEHRDLILLEIDPKMSFGTGYHETTRLMLRMLPPQIEAGMRVLDAGTGTGILAIASAKLGAAHVDGFDVDPWSQRNALENVYLNEVQDVVRIHEGSIDVVPRTPYDVVLANINLNVIIGMLEAFADRLVPDGRLLTSGILTKDRDRLLQAAGEEGFALTDEWEEGEWWCGCFQRSA